MRTCFSIPAQSFPAEIHQLSTHRFFHSHRNLPTMSMWISLRFEVATKHMERGAKNYGDYTISKVQNEEDKNGTVQSRLLIFMRFHHPMHHHGNIRCSKVVNCAGLLHSQVEILV